MNARVITALAIIAVVLSLRASAARTRDVVVVALRPVALGELAVTEGAIEPLASGELSISAPKVRAVAASLAPRSVELRFRVLGPATSVAPLSDGEVREQLGLKLRAQDACNVVYVMWRLKPKSVLAVHLKRNPGLRSSAECGPRGYSPLSPPRPLPSIAPGSSHTLRADLDEDRLVVRVDGEVAWTGSIGADLPLAAPVGLRTDNVHVEFALAVSR